MKNIGSNKNLLKDAAILITLVLMLVALPWTQDLLQTSDESTTSGRVSSPVELPQDASPATPDLAAIEEEKAFIAEVLPKISSWQVDTIEPYLADATKSGDWSSEIGSVLTILSERLGQLERHDDPVLIPIADTPTSAGDEALSEYEIVAYYAKGVADISLVLADSGSENMLYSFNIHVQDSVSLR